MMDVELLSRLQFAGTIMFHYLFTLGTMMIGVSALACWFWYRETYHDLLDLPRQSETGFKQLLKPSLSLPFTQPAYHSARLSLSPLIAQPAYRSARLSLSPLIAVRSNTE